LGAIMVVFGVAATTTGYFVATGRESHVRVQAFSKGVKNKNKVSKPRKRAPRPAKSGAVFHASIHLCLLMR